ncbi:MAG TPA: MurR/RpiR family transcriptional regulator [Synergistaceae bacterium]|nr:MurR/RpiR family transcriptional regulator [Synergistaceae bacterium]HPJ26592.1 MurR/RpiR family transcriptional regulator [Synergistaceae bacterium]HPQ37343.1 MurR/RpiR family transcriptional regulator [Synergistaceae bacterium]
MLFEERLREKAGKFSPSHRRIAAFLMQNRRKAMFMTASEIARELKVSESTVFRFATTLGYRGYPELKSALREKVYEARSVPERVHAFEPAEGEENLVRRVLRDDMENLGKALYSVDFAAVEALADKILTVRSVYCVCERSSRVLGEYLHFYLSWFLPHIHLLEPFYAVERVANLGSEDMLLGFTFNRCIQATVELLATAKKRNIVTGVVTDCISSPAARWADYVVGVPSNCISFIDSYAAPISLINALCLVVARKCPERSSKVFPVVEEMWQERQTYVTKNTFS